jgi:predicted transcriptional regulator
MTKSKLLAYLIAYQDAHSGPGPTRERIYDDLCVLQDQVDGVRTCLRDLRRAGLVHEHGDEVRVTRRARTWVVDQAQALARRNSQ